jgi:predicted transposase/invertase (TIGR01784 family)
MMLRPGGSHESLAKSLYLRMEKQGGSVFEVAEIARFTPEQERSYETSLKYDRDMKNSFDTAFDDGRQEGREQGSEEGQMAITRKLLGRGMSVPEIVELSELSEEQIKGLHA